MSDNRAPFIAYVNHIRATAEEVLAKFRASVAKDPLYAFEWSDEAVESAAELMITGQILTALENGAGLVSVAQMCTKNALDGARHPKASTSVMQNFGHRCQVSVWARMAKETSGFVGAD